MFRQLSSGVTNIRVVVMAGLLIFAATHAVAAIERISLSTSGVQPDEPCFSPAVSANGRFVAFVSRASNLVPDDTNGRWDVFVRDRQTGETTRVSVRTGGVELNEDSGSPSLSADGRYVAFESRADNAVPNDTNAVSDIFLHDRQTGQTTRVSRASDGEEANNESVRPSITPNGRHVVFVSAAWNLVLGDTDDEQYDVFVRDLVTGTNRLVTVTNSGAEAFGFNGSISDDGRFVAFDSNAPDLPGPISGEGSAIYLRDLQGGTVGVSRSTSGALIASEGGFMISGDGTSVAFDVRNQPVVDGNTNRHVYVRNLSSSTTSRVSVSTLGSPGNSPSPSASNPSISRDGRFVAFSSASTNLVEGDDNERRDVFLRDRVNSTTVRLSETADGMGGDDHSSEATVSSNGEVVVFASDATNLVAGDTNGNGDIFAVEINPPNTPVGNDVVVTAGAVTVTFSTITSAGETEIVPIDPSAAGTLPGGYVLDGVSIAVQITTTAAYTPPIQVCFVANTTDPGVFASLRILHNEGGVLVDRTILPPDSPAPDFTTKIICARVDNLSPFLLASLGDASPPNTTANLSQAPNAAGWHRQDVTVTLTASDNDGSGVWKLIYQASGAQPIATTEVEGSSVALPSITTDGETSIQYYAIDNAGNEEALKTLTVRIDKTPPSVTCAATPSVLWPANNKMVRVSMQVESTDAISGAGGVILTGVTSNELGGADIAGFVIGAADFDGELRAKRDAKGSGRIYTATYSASDLAGNTATCQALVNVPHDQGK